MAAMSRRKEFTMKGNRRDHIKNPERFVNIDLLDDVLNLTGLPDLAIGEEMVSLPRGDYDALVQRSAIYDAICRLLTKERYISDDVLRSLLNVPKAVEEE